MDNSLTLFDFNSQSIRVLTINNEPWFAVVDVCRVLDTKNVSDAIKRIDAEDLDDIDLSDTIGRDQKHTITNESGLYTLVLSSRKLVAKPFKRWVTKEVLPSIRKTGKYEVEQKSNPEQLFSRTSLVIRESFRESGASPETVSQLILNAGTQIMPEIKAFVEPCRQNLINSTAQEFRLLTPTEIGKELGISGQAVNKLLVAKGFQVKNEKRKSRKDAAYLPSGEGAEFSDLTLATGSGKDGTTYQQLRWYSSVLEVLKAYGSIC